jgi:hypothetical protein
MGANESRERRSQDGKRRVWTLEHTFEAWHANEDRIIGVFDTEQAASAVLEDLKTKPGFRDALDPTRVDSLQGFNLDPCTLDEDDWKEGFDWEHDPAPWTPGEDTFECFPVDAEPDVFVLDHRRCVGPHVQTCAIGLYSSYREALAAVYRLMPQPGFRAFPQGFVIRGLRINTVHWADGFDSRDAALHELLNCSLQTFEPEDRARNGR